MKIVNTGETWGATKCKENVTLRLGGFPAGRILSLHRQNCLEVRDVAVFFLTDKAVGGGLNAVWLSLLSPLDLLQQPYCFQNDQILHLSAPTSFAEVSISECFNAS